MGRTKQFSKNRQRRSTEKFLGVVHSDYVGKMDTHAEEMDEKDYIFEFEKGLSDDDRWFYRMVKNLTITAHEHERKAVLAAEKRARERAWGTLNEGEKRRVSLIFKYHSMKDIITFTLGKPIPVVDASIPKEMRRAVRVGAFMRLTCRGYTDHIEYDMRAPTVLEVEVLTHNGYVLKTKRDKQGKVIQVATGVIQAEVRAYKHKESFIFNNIGVLPAGVYKDIRSTVARVDKRKFEKAKILLALGAISTLPTVHASPLCTKQFLYKIGMNLLIKADIVLLLFFTFFFVFICLQPLVNLAEKYMKERPHNPFCLALSLLSKSIQFLVLFNTFMLIGGPNGVSRWFSIFFNFILAPSLNGANGEWTGSDDVSEEEKRRNKEKYIALVFERYMKKRTRNPYILASSLLSKSVQIAVIFGAFMLIGGPTRVNRWLSFCRNFVSASSLNGANGEWTGSDDVNEQDERKRRNREACAARVFKKAVAGLRKRKVGEGPPGNIEEAPKEPKPEANPAEKVKEEFVPNLDTSTHPILQIDPFETIDPWWHTRYLAVLSAFILSLAYCPSFYTFMIWHYTGLDIKFTTNETFRRIVLFLVGSATLALAYRVYVHNAKVSQLYSIHLGHIPLEVREKIRKTFRGIRVCNVRDDMLIVLSERFTGVSASKHVIFEYMSHMKNVKYRLSEIERLDIALVFLTQQIIIEEQISLTTGVECKVARG